MRYIKDYSFSNRFDRIFPYLIFIVSGIALIHFYNQVQLPSGFTGISWVCVAVAITGFLVNFFWKISVHMLAIGGLIGTVISMSFHMGRSNPYGLFMILFVLAGLLGVSRLYLKASTAPQVYVGFILGFIVAYLVIVCYSVLSYLC